MMPNWNPSGSPKRHKSAKIASKVRSKTPSQRKTEKHAKKEPFPTHQTWKIELPCTRELNFEDLASSPFSCIWAPLGLTFGFIFDPFGPQSAHRSAKNAFKKKHKIAAAKYLRF